MSATIAEIIYLVALNFSIEPTDIIGGRGDKHICLARHVAMYLARHSTQRPYGEIAKVFGRTDHSTIGRSVELIAVAIKTDQKLAALVRVLQQNLDFAEDIKKRGSIDVLALARRIQRNPRHAGLTASVYEIAALAATVLDIWELRDAYAELVAALKAPLLEAMSHSLADTDGKSLIDDLTHNIETMERLITGEGEDL